MPPDQLADGQAVAKAWLLELLGAAPLRAAAAVPVADLAARGPALCAALLRAVGAEPELERLCPGGDLRPLAAGAAGPAGAGAGDPAAAAVAALRRALWAALLAALPRPDAPAVAALAERVQHVADIVTGAVLEPPIQDALRGAEEPALAAVARRLELHRGDGAPFAVLAVEADDAERLLAAGGADGAALHALEAAVRAAVQPADAVVREPGGRLWVVAPGLDAAGGRARTEELAASIAAVGAPHGVPLRASFGLATCPGDGADARTLVDRADERLFAARAAGVPVLG